MYDPSGAGVELRSRVAVVLGLWHPLKQLMLMTWRRHATNFFAPLLHSLIPGSRFFEKPQLVKLHSIFSYLRLCYPAFKERLHNGLTNDRITLVGRAFIQ